MKISNLGFALLAFVVCLSSVNASILFEDGACKRISRNISVCITEKDKDIKVNKRLKGAFKAAVNEIQKSSVASKKFSVTGDYCSSYDDSYSHDDSYLASYADDYGDGYGCTSIEDYSYEDCGSCYGLFGTTACQAAGYYL